MRGKNFIFALLIFGLVAVSCKQGVDDGRLRETLFDQIGIPDAHNTGTKSGTEFLRLNETGEILPNVVLQKRLGENRYVISSWANKLETFPDVCVIENYDFSDMDFAVYNADRFPVNKKIIFNNCKFKSFNNPPSEKNKSRIYIEFNFCEFRGKVTSSYITLNDCKIGGYTDDGMNPLTEFYANRLYIYDLMHEARLDEVHVDGFQIYGNYLTKENEIDGHWVSNVNTGKINLNTVRFEIPSPHFSDNASFVNACAMFQLEFSDVDNVRFENLFINGGETCPIFLNAGKNYDKSARGKWSHKNFSLKNAYVSDNFAKTFYSNASENFKVENVAQQTNVYITSIWKDSDGSLHIMASNDTRTDATVTVKTDAGSFSFEIPHCPSNWALKGKIGPNKNPGENLVDKNGRPYTTYRWEDFPFDKEFIFEGNPNFAACYQGDTLLSYKSFDGKTHYLDEVGE